MCVTVSLQESDEPSEKETKEKSPSESSSEDYNKDVVSRPLSHQYNINILNIVKYITISLVVVISDIVVNFNLIAV